MSEEDIIKECIESFYLTASLQGRLAYLIMSIHAVNPEIVSTVWNYNPKPLLFSNMLYGIGVYIYSRPNMMQFNPIHRTTFSVLGSMSFNYSSMLVYDWLVEKLSDRPYLLTFMGFLCGRLMMLHLLAYIYHVDNRVPGSVRRNSAFDAMYM